LPLSFSTSLKLTTAKYYTPSGRCIQEIDYSDNNEIFSAHKLNLTKKFYTDNKREVFANGGIKPDSTVSNSSQSKQIQTLLARGMFFRFTTKYFNTNPILKIENIDEDSLFEEFLIYLSEHKFEYNSKSEKLLEELEKIAETEEMNDNIKSILKTLDREYLLEKSVELQKHKSEIICLIKEELAARINGREGRIIQGIKKDRQFKVAHDILNNNLLYNHLLGSSH
jgi:carboxyl-terminal processing protease